MVTLEQVENETRAQTLRRTNMGRNLEPSDYMYLQKSGFGFSELKYLSTVWEEAFGIKQDQDLFIS